MPTNAPHFFNTLTRRKEPFEPLQPPRVTIYSCGPTVYDHPHLGNFRYFVWVDLLHRFLRWRGFDVTLVVNITDVDDKTIARAQQQGQPLREYTERYAESFLRGLDCLGVRPADNYPRATDHIPEMIRLVQRLLDSAHAYRAGDSVFFSVAAFAGYGALARLDPEEMQSTDRVEADEYGKRDPRDFALWKGAKPGEPSWDAPFGSGRPGWHLECSAMSMKYLGDSFDMHLGGTDLVFPHHENEIAQSEAATGKRFVRTWLHCSHLIVDGVKMSKSLGNFYTLGALIERGHDPVAIRYLLESVHYRRQLNFTFEALEQASASIARVRDLVVRARREQAELPASVPERSAALRAALEHARCRFVGALEDDLNTAGALGHVFTLVRETNTALDDDAADGDVVDAIVDWLSEIDTIWGILPASDPDKVIRFEHNGQQIVARGPTVDSDIEALILQRARARSDRDFAAADALRGQLVTAGVEVEDSVDGVRWRLRRTP